MEFLLAGVAVDALGDAHHRHVADAQLLHDLAHGTDLPGPAVDQQQVRPGAALAFRVFLQQALEAAGQHLLHHAEVVAGDQILAPDVEFAILVLLVAVGPHHDHRADGEGPLDVAVVIDLDPAGHLRQVERVGHALQQPTLRRRLAHLPRKTFAGVAQGALDQLRLFSALGHNDLDLAAQLFAQRLRHEVGVVQPVAQNQHLRRLPVGVELADEGVHHFRGVLVAAHPGIIVVVAPVLVRADEEHLHAGLPAVDVQADDVCLLDSFRVDALRGLDLRQRLDPVAHRRRALEFHGLRRFGHLGGQRLLDPFGPPRQESLSIAHTRTVILAAYQSAARAGAALDLILQAGPRPRLEILVRAVAQQEHALQLVQRPVHRTGTCEGAVVIALLGLGAAMLLDLRPVVPRGHEDVRE